MIEMYWLFIIVLVVLGATSFVLGYYAADNRNTRIQRGLRGQLRLAQHQRNQLGAWVRKNWPNEYHAFRSGHEEGYQQGLSHAPVLMDEAETAEGA